MRGEFRADRYVLVERIGVGGMAEVFLARAYGPQGETAVVLKRILPHLCESREFRDMFTDEARISSLLDHPNIVRQLDLGVIDEQLFLAFELVEGSDLQKLLARARTLDIQLSIEAALFVTCELLAALDYSHRLVVEGRHIAIIHRDVSPANLLISAKGEVKLADFGVAKASVRSAVTTAGVVKGNYRYMSPEQVSGRPIDHRTDIYAAGMVLMTLLLGKHPFEDEPLPNVLDRVVSGTIPRASELDPHLPSGLDPLLMKALDFEPANRWGTAAAFRRSIEDFWGAKKIASGKRDLMDFLRDAMTGTFVAAGERIPSIVARIAPLISDAVRAEAPKGAKAVSVFVSTGDHTKPTDVPAEIRAPLPKVGPTPAPQLPPLVPAKLGMHKQAAAAIASSRDGRRIVSAGHDGIVKAWDLETRREVRALRGHRAAVTSIAITADGQLAVTGSRDKVLRAWAVDAGEPIAELAGHEGWIFSVAIAKNGAVAISGSFDRTVRVWNVTEAKQVRVLDAHKDAVASVGLSNDGRWAISAGYDKTLRVWDVESGAEVRCIREGDSLRACALAPDGRRALTGGAEGLVRLWDLGNATEMRTMVGHREPVVALGFSSDGRVAASCSYDGTVRLWSVDRGHELRVVDVGTAVMASAFVGDLGSIVSAASDGAITLWEKR